MLQETFVHVPGVGLPAERRLWKQGCHNWDCYLDSGTHYSVGSASREVVKQEITRSREALREGHFQYFQKRLRQKNAWRSFEAFRDTTVYLDIETDGTSDQDSVSVIGLYDKNGFRALVKGEDLESFRDIITHYSTIVTFFGTGFDIPVLQKRFPGVTFDQIHIDLHPLLRKLGYKGGLKKIEVEFGLKRSDETDGLTGRDAVFLWKKHLRGYPGALETLVAYNKEDVVNLEPLMIAAFSKMRAEVCSHRQAILPGFDD